MKKAFTFSLLVYMILIANIVWSKIIHVPNDQPTIQAGIDAALDGDTVLVADGMYTGDGNKNLDFKGKDITVTSENGAESTIIDCEKDGRGFIFQSGESSSSTVSGYTITNGFVITDNRSGSGIYCYESSPTITNNIITGNSAGRGEDYGWGGGIYCSGSSPTIANNIITRNWAGYGGGIFCGGSSPMIINNTITGNTAEGLGGFNSGGIDCHSSSPTVMNNMITENKSFGAWGGGINCCYSSPIITNNIIMRNEGDGAGGINCVDYSSPIITNNIIVGNEAYLGAIGCCTYSSPIITNNTIEGNLAEGITCFDNSSPTLTNTILWNDSPQEIYLDEDSSITVTYSDIQGGWEGEGNIDADPLFVDPDNGDYHLQSGSPCIDAGTPEGAPPDDIEGNPRDEFPDMGAYEYQGGGPDTTPPSAITDFATSSPTPDSITLTWTAPGDDGDVGLADQYDIRYSTSPIDDGNWDSATQVDGEPKPSPAGTQEIFTVTGLSIDTTYYFAMKTADEVPNLSELSNVTSVNFLLAQYEPILYLHPREMFLPMNVEAFVGSCSLWKNNPFPEQDEEKIGDGEVTLDDLDLGADQKDYFLKFVQDSLMPTIQDSSPKDIIPPALRLYMKLLTSQALAEYKDISGEKRIYYARKTEDAGYIVLQYWFFYAYNSWGSYSGFGPLSGGANVHEGDWEMISIFLKPGADKPEYAAYSAHHDSGDKVTMLWENVPKDPENGHPIVYVALGSHANYFKSGLILRELGFVDMTSNKGKHIGPGQDIKWETPFILDDANLPVWISNYAGNWGLDSALPFNGFSGPEGPAFQGDKWEHPVTWETPPETAVALSPIAVASGNVPVKNMLSQNYPNPFNPDTWIPYSLAQDANITISIYNAKGQLIRILNLGGKKAGIYVSKDEAAYWDGRDNSREKVASGVYFYTLQVESQSRQRPDKLHPDKYSADSFRITRKMVILK